MIMEKICEFLDTNRGQYFSMQHFINQGLNQSGVYRALKRIKHYDDYEVKIIFNPKTKKLIGLYGKK